MAQVSQSHDKEIDLIDMIGFFWRSRWFVGISMAAFLIGGFAYQATTARVTAFRSTVVVTLGTGGDVHLPSSSASIVSVLNLRLNTLGVFKEAYRTLDKTLGKKLEPLSFDSAWSLQVYRENNYSMLRPIGFDAIKSDDEHTAKMLMTLNLPQKLDAGEIETVAKALLDVLTSNFAAKSIEEAPEPFFVSIFEYVTIEEELQKRAEALTSTAKVMFNANATLSETKADRLYRMLAILQLNKKLTPAESRTYAARISIAAQNILAKSDQAPPYAQINKVTAEDVNMRVARSSQKLLFLAGTYLGIGFCVGLLLFAMRDFYLSNSRRLKLALSKR